MDNKKYDLLKKAILDLDSIKEENYILKYQDLEKRLYLYSENSYNEYEYKIEIKKEILIDKKEYQIFILCIKGNEESKIFFSRIPSVNGDFFIVYFEEINKYIIKFIGYYKNYNFENKILNLKDKKIKNIFGNTFINEKLRSLEVYKNKKIINEITDSIEKINKNRLGRLLDKKKVEKSLSNINKQIEEGGIINNKLKNYLN